MVEEPTGVDAQEEDGGPVVPHEHVTVELDYPIVFGSQTISSLTFRPLTAKDMMRSSGTLQTMMSQKTMLEYAGLLSGQPQHIIEKMAASDAIQVIGVVANFLAPSRGSGRGL